MAIIFLIAFSSLTLSNIYGQSRTSSSSSVHFPTPSAPLTASRVNQQISNGNIQLSAPLTNSRDRVGPPTNEVRPAVRQPARQPPTNTNNVSNKKKVTALKVQDFDDLKVKVRDMTRASDFFAALGANEPLESDDGGRGRRPAPVQVTDQAGCEPENKTIDLVSYTATIDDPTVAIFPRCIRVPRCGGCCYPSHLFECLPTRTSIKKVVRGMVKLRSSLTDPSTGRRRRESSVMETIDVEVHESCRCQCKVMESDCDDEKHIYRSELCSCMCANVEAQNDCIERGFTHIWDTKDCVCRCRNRRHCSTGLVFNEDDCDCVLP